jgi:hypothetical protein
MGKSKKKKKYEKANIDHIAHQINVTGVGPAKDESKYNRNDEKKKIREEVENY